MNMKWRLCSTHTCLWIWIFIADATFFTISLTHFCCTFNLWGSASATPSLLLPVPLCELLHLQPTASWPLQHLVYFQKERRFFHFMLYNVTCVIICIRYLYSPFIVLSLFYTKGKRALWQSENSEKSFLAPGNMREKQSDTSVIFEPVRLCLKPR